MFFRLSMGAGLIAATAFIQALFMSVGLNNLKPIEERRPGSWLAACDHDSESDVRCVLQRGLAPQGSPVFEQSRRQA